MIQQIAKSFNVNVTPKQVKRKWQTLMDGFKKAIDNNSETGRCRIKFVFLNEMTALLGDRPDINFVVTGMATSVQVHRPEAITLEGNDADVSVLSEPGIDADHVGDSEQAEGGRPLCPDAVRPGVKYPM